MIYKSIRIKEGIFERTIDFSSGVNLVFSQKNSKGKSVMFLAEKLRNVFFIWCRFASQETIESPTDLQKSVWLLH